MNDYVKKYIEENSNHMPCLGQAVSGSDAGLASCIPTLRNTNPITNGEYDLYLLKLRAMKTNQFYDILKGRLSSNDQETINKAVDMFDNGLIPISDVLSKERIDIDNYIVEFPEVPKIDEVLQKNINELHERSFRVKENHRTHFEYVQLDKKTKELLAVGDEQGNYCGGIYSAYYHSNWNAEEEMIRIKNNHPYLYNKIIKEQSK